MMKSKNMGEFKEEFSKCNFLFKRREAAGKEGLEVYRRLDEGIELKEYVPTWTIRRRQAA